MNASCASVYNHAPAPPAQHNKPDNLQGREYTKRWWEGGREEEEEKKKYRYKDGRRWDKEGIIYGIVA